MWVCLPSYKNFYICTLMHICLFFKKWRQRSDSDFRLSTFNSLQGCLPFKKKFRKFRMEGKRLKGHFSEIPTENWGVRFEVVRSFRLVRTKRNFAYHLPIYNFKRPGKSSFAFVFIYFWGSKHFHLSVWENFQITNQTFLSNSWQNRGYFSRLRQWWLKVRSNISCQFFYYFFLFFSFLFSSIFVQETGSWILDSWFHVLDSGFKVLDSGFQSLVGFRIP